MKVLVAIPCYRCEPQIGRVLDGFDDALMKRIAKVIVIDNGSPDGTIAAALKHGKRLGNKFEVYRNDANYWLGGSHKVAFLHGEAMGADYVAILHGDDQAVTSELNLLIDAAEQHPEAAATLGSRFSKGSRLVGYDWKRIWGNRMLNAMYTVVSGRRTQDLGSGINLFRLKDLADHRYLGMQGKMTFNMELLLDYYGKKSKLVFVPITWREEDQVTNARNLDVAWTAFKKLLQWRLGGLKLDATGPEDYKSTRQEAA